ncbi:hypothetical protein ABZS88_17605 [Streptomyces sp. NPDC005480]|uniref:hypothetical protein n=1 Tax=Streptomyces sp. NPDC005480 TaxID=3154880 RepID=UPI0033AAEC81
MGASPLVRPGARRGEEGLADGFGGRPDHTRPEGAAGTCQLTGAHEERDRKLPKSSFTRARRP